MKILKSIAVMATVVALVACGQDKNTEVAPQAETQTVQTQHEEVQAVAQEAEAAAQAQEMTEAQTEQAEPTAEATDDKSGTNAEQKAGEDQQY